MADLLERDGVEIYFPLQEEVHQWSDRRKKVKMPVFRSYIFVHMENYSSESIGVLETPGAVKFLWWMGKPGIVRDNEIEDIRHFLQKYGNSHLHVDYQVGEHVIVSSGPFMEKHGVIVDLQNKKAVLFIESMGAKLSAQLPLSVLKKEPCK